MSEFSATSTCPRCGHIGTHWIQEPPQPPEVLDQEETIVSMWGGAPARIDTTPTYAPGTDPEAIQFNTDNCTVVRTCRTCEHKWGES